MRPDAASSEPRGQFRSPRLWTRRPLATLLQRFASPMPKFFRTLAAWLVPLARRAYVETGLVAMATLWQGLRLINLSAAWWRRGKAIRSLRDAQALLGECLYKLGLGEDRFRAALARLDEQILNQQAAGAGSRWLQTQRRGLLIRMAEPVLAAAVPPAGAEAAHAAARLARLNAAEQSDRYLDAWHNLFPAQAAMRVRVLCGVAVLFIAAYAIWPSGATSPATAAQPRSGPGPTAAVVGYTRLRLEPRAWRRLQRGHPPLAVKPEEVDFAGGADSPVLAAEAPVTNTPPPSATNAAGLGYQSEGRHPAEATNAEVLEPAEAIHPNTGELAFGTTSALHAAAQRGHKKQLQALLEAGADPNQAQANGVTALHVAALYGQEQACSLLVAHGARLDVRDILQRTPLYYAVCGGHVGAVRFLLAKGADWRLADRGGWTPATLAVHQDAVSLLVVFAHGAPRALEVRDTRSMLHVAARWNRLASVRYLVGQKLAPVAPADASGRTPLHLAGAHGATEVLVYLLQQSAFCDEWDDMRCTPLHYAAAGSALPAVEALLERGASVEAATVAGDRPLHYAAAFADVPVLEALLAHGAMPRATNRWGDNPVHAAAYEGNVRALAYLLRHSPRLARAANRVGHTPLHLAAARGHAAAVKLLLEQGARPDERDAHGCTPLHLAAWAGHLEAAQALVAAGAELNALADYDGGATALDLAFGARRRGLVRWLRAQGARLAADL